MKHYISVVSILLSLIFLPSLNAQEQQKNKSTKKTVVIKYNPDNREITKVIPLETVQYDIVQQFCAPLLSSTGSMAFLKERQAVIIFDKKNNCEKIAGLIKKLDVPAVNIRIDVDFAESGNSRDDELNVAFGNQKTPNVNNKIIFKNGKMVKIDRIGISGAKRSGETTRNTSQFIVTRSGHPAQLWVGKTIADPSWLRNRVLVPTVIIPVGGGAIVIPGSDNDIVWRDIGSALYVLPTYLGDDRIKLELYPVVSYLQDDPEDVKNNRKEKRQTVMVQDMKTSLILKNGQRVSIGGVINSNKELYTNLFGPDIYKRTGNNNILDMYVTATVLKPGSSGRRSYIPRTPDMKKEGR